MSVSILEPSQRTASPSTAEGRLLRHSGIGPGFDVLRLSLAVLIFFMHTRGISGVQGHIVDFSPGLQKTVNLSLLGGIDHLKSIVRLLYVPMFFALSGFLVTGSAVRLKNARIFVLFRCMRIVPALALEVTLSALVLGPIATSLSMRDYLSSNQFFSYFLNILGIVHFSLPGVFHHLPEKDIININLWTLPSEFYCYLLMTMLLLASAIRSRSLILAGFLLWLVVSFVWDFRSGIVPMNAVAPMSLIVTYFFCGVVCFLWRDRLVLKAWYCFACVILTFVAYEVQGCAFLAVLPLTYVTIYLGCSELLSATWLKNHDISYGVYLYGYPISQFVIFLSPQLTGHNLELFVIAGTTTVCFALFSWHFIERPTLKLKRLLERGKPLVVSQQSRGISAAASTGNTA